jgi:hypothetical protein
VVGKLTAEVRYLTSKNRESQLNEQPHPFLHSNTKMSRCVLKEKITDTDYDFEHLPLYCLDILIPAFFKTGSPGLCICVPFLDLIKKPSVIQLPGQPPLDFGLYSHLQ